MSMWRPRIVRRRELGDEGRAGAGRRLGPAEAAVLGDAIMRQREAETVGGFAGGGRGAQAAETVKEIG